MRVAQSFCALLKEETWGLQGTESQVRCGNPTTYLGLSLGQRRCISHSLMINWTCPFRWTKARIGKGNSEPRFLYLPSSAHRRWNKLIPRYLPGTTQLPSQNTGQNQTNKQKTQGMPILTPGMFHSQEFGHTYIHRAFSLAKSKDSRYYYRLPSNWSLQVQPGSQVRHYKGRHFHQPGLSGY